MPCSRCAEEQSAPFDFTFAFQPIVHVPSRTIYSYEALVRGLQGESASSILERVTDDNRYAFDQACRVRSVELAARLGVPCRLNVNFMPNAVYEPRSCIQTTLAAAKRSGFPIERIVFEITEGEKILDHAHLVRIIQEYKTLGFATAIDDFGAGYSGLNLLAEYQPNAIKLDMLLTRGIDRSKPRQAIVGGIVQVCRALGIDLIAEGIETRGEFAWLLGAGIDKFQGYLFAKPALEALPAVPDAAWSA